MYRHQHYRRRVNWITTDSTKVRHAAELAVGPHDMHGDPLFVNLLHRRLPYRAASVMRQGQRAGCAEDIDGDARPAPLDSALYSRRRVGRYACICLSSRKSGPRPSASRWRYTVPLESFTWQRDVVPQQLPEDVHERVIEIGVLAHARQAGIVVMEHPAVCSHRRRRPHQPFGGETGAAAHGVAPHAEPPVISRVSGSMLISRSGCRE